MSKKAEVANDRAALLEAAANVLWGRPLPADLSEAVAACEKANKVLIQFLDGYPVTLAMQFAVAYGWALRERAELAERRLT